MGRSHHYSAVTPEKHQLELVKDTERLQGVYIRKLQKLIQNLAFRKKLTQRFTADHTAFEYTGLPASNVEIW
jgi:hypothetical protein